MQIIGEIFNFFFFQPIINLLVFILRILQTISFPFSLGFSIIILSILVRLLIWPMITKQLLSAKKMADLKPHLDQLKKKHSGDKQAFSKAQMDLYKEHGVNPAGGCLPTLIQFPVFIALYQTIFAFFNGHDGLEKINNLLYFSSWKLNNPPDSSFFGLSLNSKPSEFASAGYFLLLIPVITALLTLIQSKMMSPKTLKISRSDSNKEKKEKAEENDAMSAVQSQMTYMMPVMIGFFAWQFPTGLALYWNTFTLFSIFQQYMVSGWGGMEDLINRVKSFKTMLLKIN